MQMIYLGGPIVLKDNTQIGKKLFEEPDALFFVDAYDIVNLIGYLSRDKKQNFGVNKNFLSSENFMDAFFRVFDNPDVEINQPFKAQLFHALRFAFCHEFPICILNPELINLETEFIDNPNRTNLFDLNSMYKDLREWSNEITSAKVYGIAKGAFLPEPIESLLTNIQYTIET